MYVYKRTEPGLWTVGYYAPPHDRWSPESDHSSQEEAAARVHWLNGGGATVAPTTMSEAELTAKIDAAYRAGYDAGFEDGKRGKGQAS